MSEMEDFVHRVSYYDKKTFGTINEYWAKAVRLIRAKEFFAEFLGTFVLVVSLYIVPMYTCSHLP